MESDACRKTPCPGWPLHIASHEELGRRKHLWNVRHDVGLALPVQLDVPSHLVPVLKPLLHEPVPTVEIIRNHVRHVGGEERARSKDHWRVDRVPMRAELATTDVRSAVDEPNREDAGPL